jgi:tetratricopeptide (TPR) repeat protein
MKRLHPLVLAIGVCLLFGAGMKTAHSEASKKQSYQDRVAGESYDAEGNKTDAAAATTVIFPLAVRQAPKQEGSKELGKKRNQMIIAYQKKQFDEAKQFADAVKSDPSANANDKGTAARVLLLLITTKDKNNHKDAIPELEEAINSNGLDNNAHYSLMSELAQRYLANQDYQDALETADKFLNETKTEKKEILAVKGNSLYRLKREKDAIVVLEKVHTLDANDVAVTQMLARAYSDIGQKTKAAELTKAIAQASGGDRVAQINLAITYRDAKQYEQAADVIADLRKNQQLVEERDYLTAMNIYSAMKNKEADLASIIEQGLEKGALKPTANNYNVLAEAYYYSNQTDKAIANWTKSAPLSKDGAVYLNLAIVQCQESKWAACKESAKSAIAKGGINANDAKIQIANADKELGKSK